MARGDGIHRTNARNMRLTQDKIRNTQQHNEREKASYVNQDIVPERTPLNVHFKTPECDYAETFEQMKCDGIISTRGLKDDAFLYGELVFDVNSAYFHNHGGYEFAKQFYAEAYKAAVEIVGGEQYILSAVMHADERNRAMSEALGQDIYHYHLHVVYIPVVEKQVLWSKRCKDPALVGTVKETIHQVSMSKKWASQPAIDENGHPILTASGKPVLKKSYSVLQDQFYEAMCKAGYTDLERGERGSSEEHLTVTQFKVRQEQFRLADLRQQHVEIQQETENLRQTKAAAEKELQQAETQLNEVAPKLKNMEKLVNEYTEDAETILPAPELFESAKAYRTKKAMPFYRKIIQTLRSVYHSYLDLKSKYARLENSYNREVAKNKSMTSKIQTLSDENRRLKSELGDFERIKLTYQLNEINSLVHIINEKAKTNASKSKKQYEL